MGRTDGIDVSSYQGNIDYAAVRSTGIQWVGMRATVRSRPDTHFPRNRAGFAWARCRLLYDFLVPPGDAGPFLTTVGALQPGEAAMLDAEDGGLTEAHCLRWLSEVEARTGRPSVVYAGRYGPIWNSSRIFDGTRARIFPAYRKTEPEARAIASPHGWDAWQWTETGSVPGVPTLVDIDQVDDWAAFDRCAGVGHELTPADRVWFRDLLDTLT